MYNHKQEERKIWIQAAKIKCALCREDSEKYKYEFISSRQFCRLLRISDKMKKIPNTSFYPQVIFSYSKFSETVCKINLPYFSNYKFKIDLEPYRLKHSQIKY